MPTFLAGFFSGLFFIAVPLLVRFVKDGFHMSITNLED